MKRAISKIFSYFSKFAQPSKSDHELIKKIEQLHAFRSLGETFSYMGVEVKVTGYSTLIGSRAGIPMVIPQLRGDYVNAMGEVKELRLSYAEAMRIAREMTSDSHEGARYGYAAAIC